MKTFVTTLLMSTLLVIGTSCGNDTDDNGGGGGGGQGGGGTALDQTEIRQKIAGYYSAPSSTTQAVEAIRQAFAADYPGATDTEWKVSNNVYEIEFELADVDHEVWYDSDANLLMHKHDITTGQMPAAVNSAIATDYPGYTIDDPEIVYKGNITGYYVDLKKDKTEIHAFYNQDGTFISKTLWEDDTLKPAEDAGATTPPISSSITADEADALIQAYYAGEDRDVPTASVPNAIAQSFSTLFPAARDIDWETSANVYMVDFEINNVDYDAWYSQDGSLLAYKFDITRSSLPQAVTSAINARYAGYSIDDAEKVVKIGSTGYQVEVENRNMEEDAYFGEDGTYIARVFYRKATDPGTEPTEPITPEIPENGDYTDEEIDALLLAYERGRDVDVYPSELPAAISTAFASQFPGAYDADWERVDNIYNVDFEIGNTDYEAWYDRNGVILMYMQEVRYNTIAAAVQTAVASRYSDYVIDGCDYFQKGTVRGYIIELENRRTDAELIVLFGEDGTFISEQRD